MKALLVGAALLVAASLYTVPSFAVDGGVAPPECATQANKDKHPDWYRPGGYCALNNGTIDGDGSSAVTT